MRAKRKKKRFRLCEAVAGGAIPLSRVDKMCLLTLAALWLIVGIAGELLEVGGVPAGQPVDKPTETMIWELPVDQPRLLEAITLQLEREPYREDIPLARELQTVLREACETNKVSVPLALGLIEVESGFRSDAVSSEGAYGLCQLNPKYFPAGLTPAENISAGAAYLGELLERYKDPAVALTCYNAGYDTGSRVYADAVLAAAERWEAEHVSGSNH